MEMIAFVIAAIVISFWCGLVAGYMSCYSTIRDKLEEWRESHETDRGPDEPL